MLEKDMQDSVLLRETDEYNKQLHLIIWDSHAHMAAPHNWVSGIDTVGRLCQASGLLWYTHH